MSTGDRTNHRSLFAAVEVLNLGQYQGAMENGALVIAAAVDDPCATR